MPAVYSCIIALCLIHVYKKNLDFKEIIGLPGKEKLIRYLPVSIAISIPLGLGEYLILQPSAGYPDFVFKYFLRDFSYMLFFVGFGEEFLFRGLIQQDLTRAFGWKWGLLGASVLFALMHLTWRSVPELLFFSLGLFLAHYI